MGEPVTYLFVAEGQDTVASAFEGIGAAADKSVQRTEGSYARSARAAKSGAKAITNATIQVMSAEEAAAKKREIIAQRTEDKRLGIVRTSVTRIVSEINREAKAAEQAEAKKVRAAEQAIARRAKADAKAVKDSAQKWAQADKVAMGLVAAGAIAVGAVIGKASADALKTQSLANRISVAGRGPGGAAVDPTMLRKELEATAIAHAGQTGESVAGGIASYQEARGGDRSKALEEARRFSDVIATVASATGKGTDEIGHAAALLAKDQGVKTVDDMGNALAMLVSRARESGQPLSEAISHLDKMGATAKRLGLTGVAGAAQLGALQTLGAEGAGAGKGDAAVEAFLKRITADKTARTLKAAGIDPYADKNGTLRTPREILEGLYGKVGRADSASDKLSTISKLAGPMGAKMLDPLNKAFAQGYAGASGSDDQKVQAGVEAMLAAFDKAAAATGSYADMKRDAEQIEDDASAQMTKAWQKAASTAGDQLVPELTKLAKQLADSPAIFKALGGAVSVVAGALDVLDQSLQGWALMLGLDKAPEQKFDEDFEKGAAKEGPTGLPDYATNPAFTGQPPPFVMQGVTVPGAIEPGAAPPAVGPTPSMEAVPTGGASGASPTQAAIEGGNQFKQLVTEAAQAFLEITGQAAPAGSIYGTPRSAVNGS